MRNKSKPNEKSSDLEQSGIFYITQIKILLSRMILRNLEKQLHFQVLRNKTKESENGARNYRLLKALITWKNSDFVFLY